MNAARRRRPCLPAPPFLFAEQMHSHTALSPAIHTPIPPPPTHPHTLSVRGKLGKAPGYAQAIFNAAYNLKLFLLKRGVSHG